MSGVVSALSSVWFVLRHYIWECECSKLGAFTFLNCWSTDLYTNVVHLQVWVISQGQYLAWEHPAFKGWKRVSLGRTRRVCCPVTETSNRSYCEHHIISPLVLYGFETWSLTCREEHGLRVFENRLLKKVFGRKRDEVTRKWRRLL